MTSIPPPADDPIGCAFYVGIIAILLGIGILYGWGWGFILVGVALIGMAAMAAIKEAKKKREQGK